MSIISGSNLVFVLERYKLGVFYRNEIISQTYFQKLKMRICGFRSSFSNGKRFKIDGHGRVAHLHV